MDLATYWIRPAFYHVKSPKRLLMIQIQSFYEDNGRSLVIHLHALPIYVPVCARFSVLRWH